MKKRVFRTAFNYVQLGYNKQGKFGKSQTVPDQNMSVVEIMKRYASGRPLNGTKREPIYDEGIDPFQGVDPRSLDITERADTMRNVQRLIDEGVATQEKMKEKAAKDALYASWDKKRKESEATSGPSAANPISLEKSPPEAKK